MGRGCGTAAVRLTGGRAAGRRLSGRVVEQPMLCFWPALPAVCRCSPLHVPSLMGVIGGGSSLALAC